MRKILLCLTGAPTDLSLTQTALSLAHEFKGHVLSFFPCDGDVVNESLPIAQTLSLLFPPSQTSASPQARPSNVEAFESCFQSFKKKAQKSGLSWLEDPAEKDLPSAWMLPLEPTFSSVYQPEIALADLVIFSQSYQLNPKGWETLESILVDARRLVLLLSQEHQLKSSKGKYCIAWDGSIQASRALTRAVPFLKEAKEVFFLCIEQPKKDAISVDAGMRYLKLYDIQARVVRHKIEKSQAEEVGRAILEHATQAGVDLLIMGGYGSSKAVVEALIGGVTQYVRSQAKINLLMTH